MDATEPHRPPRLIDVQNVTLRNDNDLNPTISWDSAGVDTITKAKLNELVLILDLSGDPAQSQDEEEAGGGSDRSGESAPRRGLVLVILQEAESGQGEDTSKQFTLLALATDAVPRPLLDRSACITSLPKHLIATASNHVDIIISTKSGLGLALTFWDSVLRPLWGLVAQLLAPYPAHPSSPSPAAVRSFAADEEAHEADKSASPGQTGSTERASPSVMITQNAQSIREVARSLAPQEHPPASRLAAPSSAPSPLVSDTPLTRTVVLLSGDGGVVDILNAVAGAITHADTLGYGGEDKDVHAEGKKKDRDEAKIKANTPSATPLTIALIPLGTANALFHSLHKPVWDKHAHANANAQAAPSPLALALVTLFTGESAHLPVFRASFSPGSLLIDQPSSSASPSPSPSPVPAGPGSGGKNNDDDDNNNNNNNSNSNSNCVSSSSSNDDDNNNNNNNKVVHDGAATLANKTIEHLYGAVVASYGFHASIVYESDTPEYRAHGAKRFGMVAQDLLRESHAYLADVRVRVRPQDKDQQDQQHQHQHQHQQVLTPIPSSSGKHGYVLVTPLSNLERSFTISPLSKALDDTLRLVHFGAIGAKRTMDVMMAAYDGGRHVDMRWGGGEVGDGDGDGDGEGKNAGGHGGKVVLYQEVEEVEVITHEEDPRWRKVCVDGTIVEMPLGGRFSVQRETRRILNVLVHPQVLPVYTSSLRVE